MSELVEIERKFLLRDLPDLEDRFRGFPCTKITQGYLSFDGTECRIRRSLTVTGPLSATIDRVAFKRGDGLVRTEVEFDVPTWVADALLDLSAPYLISKRRYTVRAWEVDFFDREASEPIAEIELPSAEWEFSAPTWVDTRREVTGDPAYLNRNIALRCGVTSEGAAGYHLRHIPKGILGQVSKIREELEELEDAAVQQNHLLQLVEASDLYGALERFAELKGVTMRQLADMSAVTRRAFDLGARK